MNIHRKTTKEIPRMMGHKCVKTFRLGSDRDIIAIVNTNYCGIDFGRASLVFLAHRYFLALKGAMLQFPAQWVGQEQISEGPPTSINL